ncbi:BON domain-containing protein [Nocardioides sp. NPDC059952]|uniref:BON domain-containing protein n=1 Tax=Nocardioides sp. NPDC059952 TaxID=3347014 RepID=UPI0036494B3F
MNERLARDLEREIATDPRTNELGIRVEVRSDHLVVSGEVASEERRATVLEVVREHEPGRDIVDHVMLSAEPGPGGPGHEQIDPAERS